MAASQRARSRVPAPQRSLVPSVPGIPVGGAILIAVACTFLGFLIDALGGGKELTGTFAALYTTGCVTAVAAVRYRGLFDVMVLPPLLLFLAVPLAYQQLSGADSTSLKDILLNLAIPLVSRFPTMMSATVIVLLIGGARILMHRRTEGTDGSTAPRRGSSRGTSRTGKKAVQARSARTSGTLAEAARRKTRHPKDEPEPKQVDKPPTGSARRATTQVADTPPRATSSRPREDRANARGTAAKTMAMPRVQNTPPRGPGRRDIPPHPQPAVRYRDTARAERRRPENS
ncbi:DUF6542 domain-containing protein [Nocardia sp. 004]|uniref:DUF6542 domain-containing protein n=1 Tax=Nocardia sp. 004 TaxID=3385978 RepID=UPI0039A03D3E